MRTPLRTPLREGRNPRCRNVVGEQHGAFKSLHAIARHEPMTHEPMTHEPMTHEPVLSSHYMLEFILLSTDF